MDSHHRTHDETITAERLQAERPTLNHRDEERLRRWLSARDRFIPSAERQRALAYRLGAGGLVLAVLAVLGVAGIGPLG